ncbi:hypothetical protein Tco_0900711 [Tanacetum coccineum]
MGKDSAISTDPHHTPTIIQSLTQPQKTQKPRKPKRKDTQVPQPSDPMENVADEVVHKELGDSLRQNTSPSTNRDKCDRDSPSSNLSAPYGATDVASGRESIDNRCALNREPVESMGLSVME